MKQQRRPAQPEAPAAPTSAPPADAVADLFDQGASALGGRSGALPHRTELEQRFGADLGDIDVVLGADSVLAHIMASAATDGQTIAFADRSPDLYTVAHEVAHVLQARNGSRAASGIDGGGGTAEAEADATARAVERGEDATVEAQPDAAIHRIVENPNTFDPDPAFTGVHREITIADGFSSGPDGTPQDQASGELDIGDRMVEVHATEAAPLAFNGSPSLDQLYTVVGEGPECGAGGEPVTAISGSNADPNVSVSADPEALFIDGAPSIADIAQGGIGDCYFLAALTNITASDPERIVQCIQPAGANVDVTFFTTADAGTTWTPTTITTDRTALHWMEKADPTRQIDGLVGAGARVANQPTGAEWYCDTDGGTLTVHRRDIYEMAVWVPLIEKAYARLAERTDQYGGGPARDTPNTGASGYDQINGGWEDQVYPVFYGADCTRHGQSAMNYTPGQELVTSNLEAVRNLLRVNGVDNPGATTTFMLSVDLDQGSAIDRFDQLITHIRGLRSAQRYPSLLRTLGQLSTMCQAYLNEADATKQEAALQRLAKAAERNVAPGAWPLLESLRSDKIWGDLFEHMNIVAHLGADASNGQRNTYADHAYPVLGATFVDQAGAALALTQTNVAAELANIDGPGSRVRMRNPHGTNEPNIPHVGSDSNPEDGEFTMTLDQYLRSFALQQTARVRDTP